MVSGRSRRGRRSCPLISPLSRLFFHVKIAMPCHALQFARMVMKRFCLFDETADHPAATAALTSGVVLALRLVTTVEGTAATTTAGGLSSCEELSPPPPGGSGSGRLTPLVSTGGLLCWSRSTRGRHLVRIFVAGVFASSSENRGPQLA